MSTTTSTTGRTVFVGAVSAVVAAGLAVGLVVGLGGTSASNTTPAAPPVPTVPTASTGGGSHHHVVPTPPVTPPSAAIETLQRELGQLNYYEGPITGTMTHQTVEAITYLQRDAHLPQTGTMNAATAAALAHFLATGNNQMGG